MKNDDELSPGWVGDRRGGRADRLTAGRGRADFGALTGLDAGEGESVRVRVRVWGEGEGEGKVRVTVRVTVTG